MDFLETQCGLFEPAFYMWQSKEKNNITFLTITKTFQGTKKITNAKQAKTLR